MNNPKCFHCSHCDSYFKEDRLVTLKTGERGHTCGALPESLSDNLSAQLTKLELGHTRRMLEETWNRG